VILFYILAQTINIAKMTKTILKTNPERTSYKLIILNKSKGEYNFNTKIFNNYKEAVKYQSEIYCV
jgi:hypothetical protein